MKKALKFTGYFLGLFILVVVFMKVFFPFYQVGSYSMEPTINKTDYIIVSRFSYLFSEPERNDIVLFEPIDGMFSRGVWTHRIIAIEGDEVSVKDGFVTINGDDIIFPILDHYEDSSIKIEKGFVFQKGDNRNTIAGIIHKEKIIGKVILNF